MLTATIPREHGESYMYKSFGSNLTRPALQWYTNLTNNSISSFSKLMDIIVAQFSSSKKLEKLSGDLYQIQQHHSEPLRNYVKHYNREKVFISFCNKETVVDAFRKGHFLDGVLYKVLKKFNCTTIEEVLAQLG